MQVPIYSAASNTSERSYVTPYGTIVPMRSHWIIDPGPSLPYTDDHIDILPYMRDVNPVLKKNSIVFGSEWSVRFEGNYMIVSRDLPGVRASDLRLDLQEDKLNLVAKRFDHGGQIFDSYDLTSKVDPDDVEATLECGVLNVYLRVIVPSAGVKIPVRELP